MPLYWAWAGMLTKQNAISKGSVRKTREFLAAVIVLTSHPPTLAYGHRRPLRRAERAKPMEMTWHRIFGFRLVVYQMGNGYSNANLRYLEVFLPSL